MKEKYDAHIYTRSNSLDGQRGLEQGELLAMDDDYYRAV